MTPSSTRIGRTALLAAALMGSIGSARQPVHTYQSDDGQLTIQYGSFRITEQPDGSHRMDIQGGLDATSRSQGLHVRSKSGSAVLASAGKATAFRTIHLEQSVDLVKTSAGAGGSRTVDISCSQADYLAGTTDSTVNGRGAVHIVDRDSAKKETMSATGSTCVATLIAGRSADTSPLKTANLRGPVTVHLDQAPQTPGKAPGSLTATSNSLTYERGGGAGPQITLSGNVVLVGHNGIVDGRLGPNQVIVLQLDDQGRVKSAYGGPQQLALDEAAMRFQAPTQESSLNYNSGELVVRGFLTKPYSLTPASIQLELSGNPAEMDYNSRGIKLTGASIAFVVVKQPGGSYLLRSADASGNVKVTSDSAIQEQYAKSHGQPLEAPATVRSELTTDRLLVHGQDQTETLTSPSKFVLDGFRQATGPGAGKAASFEEQDHLEGASGIFDLVASDDGTYQFQTGSIEGPTHFHMVRTVHTLNASKPTTEIYDMIADRLVFDFTKPKGTITATGHVRIHETGDVEAILNDEKVVLTLDQNRQVELIDGSGTQTVYYPPHGGGGP